MWLGGSMSRGSEIVLSTVMVGEYKDVCLMIG